MTDQQPQKPKENQEKRKPRTRPVPLASANRDLRPTQPVGAVEPEPFTVSRPVASRPGDETEDMLNALIAEMHYFMRAVLLPSACETDDAGRRLEFVSMAGSLAEHGALLAKAIGKLRGTAPSAEQHAQIIDAVAKIS